MGGDELGRMMDEAAKPEFLLGIACVLMLIGAFAPWETVGGQYVNALGYWQGTAAFTGGLLLLFGTVVNYDLLRIRQLEMRKPFTNAGIGVLGSALGLVGALTYGLTLDPNAATEWGLYLTILAGLFGLSVAYKLYRQELPGIPKV